MSKSVKAAVWIASVLSITACTSTTTERDYPAMDLARPLQVCLVDNPNVRPQVFLTIRRALLDKNMTVKRIKPDQYHEKDRCRHVLSYEALFGSGLSNSSLRYVQLNLLEQGLHAQNFTVQWDERAYTPTLYDDVTDPNIEIRLLVDRLFPQSIPWK